MYIQFSSFSSCRALGKASSRIFSLAERLRKSLSAVSEGKDWPDEILLIVVDEPAGHFDWKLKKRLFDAEVGWMKSGADKDPTKINLTESDLIEVYSKALETAFRKSMPLASERRDLVKIVKRWAAESIASIERGDLDAHLPKCPECGKPLRTSKAKQCFHCGKTWH